MCVKAVECLLKLADVEPKVDSECGEARLPGL